MKLCSRRVFPFTISLQEMQSIQDFISLVAACTVAIIILQLLCYVMKKIRNFAVQVVNWGTARRRKRNQVEQVAVTAMNRNEKWTVKKKKPVEHDEMRPNSVSCPFYFNTKSSTLIKLNVKVPSLLSFSDL